MHRYFIFFSYDGTAYHGWQFQPNADSVQARLENALATTLRQPTGVVGAGRTDTGVHAKCMAAHFDSETPLDTTHLAFKLNCLLPKDIAVLSVREVQPDAHARFSAVSRTYRYYVTTHKNPFNDAYACRLYFSLNLEQMNQAAAFLLQHTEFGCFCKAHSDNKTNICHISRAVWTEAAPGKYIFEIRSDRFLRNMVRAIVGTLFEVGKGKISLEQFQSVLASGNRSQAGDSVPAKGLFLEEVTYPEAIFDVIQP